MDKIKTLIKRLNHRYLIIGFSVYIFELIVIIIAEAFGSSPVWAVAISFWLGLIASFILQKIVTFNDKRMHRRILIPQIVAFSALVLFNFGFTILITRLISPPVPAVISRSIALAITMIWNLYLYRKHIFESPAKDNGK